MSPNSLLSQPHKHIYRVYALSAQLPCVFINLICFNGPPNVTPKTMYSERKANKNN